VFVAWERRARQPMLDFALFRNRNFAAGNAATVAIYAGLGGSTFLIAVFLQQVAGYSATAAGLALMPLTLMMFVLSPVAGRLAGRWGPRWFMTAGPLLAAAGLALLATLDADIVYARDLLPGVSLLGLGLSTTVAPLTAAVLGGVDERHAGVGSAINNAIARVAGLLAVAAIGAIVATEAHALTADAKQASVRAFGVAMVSMAALLAVGGVVSAIGIRNRGATGADATSGSSPARP
jgi:predicted MFS family arabinose efflux permease